MKVAFTICSNNYLAKAKVLLESWYRHHPEICFKIFLVDEYHSAIDYAQFEPAEVIPIKNIVGGYLNTLAQKFDITELNTAVKADAFLYLFKQRHYQHSIYLDPDILVKAPLTEAYEILASNTAVLTPHIFTPIDDRWGPNDLHLLPTGIYNLGFLGLSNVPETEKLLGWWRSRCLKYGFRNIPQGMFCDQNWMNYAPLFFDKVVILKNLGYNMANWNLHERELSYQSTENILVNKNQRLVFFHFSGFDYKKFPAEISTYHSRFNFQNRPDIQPLFDEYHQRLKNAGMEKLATIKCAYTS